MDCSEEKEIEIVEKYLSSLSDDQLRDFPILPKCQYCIRLEFDIYKLFKYGLTLKTIVRKLQTFFLDCSYLASTERQGIIDVFFNLPDDTSPDEYEECVYTYKNFILSFEISGIIGITAVYPRSEDEAISFPKDYFSLEVSNLITDFVKEYILDTDGSNLLSTISLPGIDKTRTTTNSLWEIRTLFGIETTRIFLINQILKILSANGIFVHKKYIQLLADALTYTGNYLAATRHGMNRKIMGVFSKASFEETLSNFIIAATEGEKDDLRGISSRVILGLCGYVGSNYLKSVVEERIPEEKE